MGFGCLPVKWPFVLLKLHVARLWHLIKKQNPAKNGALPFIVFYFKNGIFTTLAFNDLLRTCM